MRSTVSMTLASGCLKMMSSTARCLLSADASQPRRACSPSRRRPCASELSRIGVPLLLRDDEVAILVRAEELAVASRWCRTPSRHRRCPSAVSTLTVPEEGAHLLEAEPGGSERRRDSPARAPRTFRAPPMITWLTPSTWLSCWPTISSASSKTVGSARACPRSSRGS